MRRFSRNGPIGFIAAVMNVTAVLQARSGRGLRYFAHANTWVQNPTRSVAGAA